MLCHSETSFLHQLLLCFVRRFLVCRFLMRRFLFAVWVRCRRTSVFLFTVPVYFKEMARATRNQGLVCFLVSGRFIAIREDAAPCAVRYGRVLYDTGRGLSLGLQYDSSRSWKSSAPGSYADREDAYARRAKQHLDYLLGANPTGYCYADNAQSYSANEVAVYWNSPLIALLAGEL